jgi:hypothetical protein
MYHAIAKAKIIGALCNTNNILQIGEEKMDSNAVSPMYGGGRVTHHNNWSQDEEFAYNKA